MKNRALACPPFYCPKYLQVLVLRMSLIPKPVPTFGRHVLDEASGDLLDMLHFRVEVAKQVLDAVLQRRRRRRAARARALHIEEHRAVLIAAEGDVAAVLRNGRTHARVKKLLDGHDDLGVGLVEELAVPV